MLMCALAVYIGSDDQSCWQFSFLGNTATLGTTTLCLPGTGIYSHETQVALLSSSLQTWEKAGLLSADACFPSFILDLLILAASLQTSASRVITF